MPMPGEGSAFTVVLPLPPAEPPEQTAAETAEEKRQTPLRLLVAEDNPVNLEIASMILTEAGYLVESAENGRIAADMVASSEPGYYAAVLMDIQMPVMDGCAASRAIRALDDPALSGVPIIAVTANAFREDVEAASAAGMQAHIAKPLDVDRMLETIRSVLEDPSRNS